MSDTSDLTPDEAAQLDDPDNPDVPTDLETPAHEDPDPETQAHAHDPDEELAARLHDESSASD
jgi:hypothetical protein